MDYHRYIEIIHLFNFIEVSDETVENILNNLSSKIAVVMMVYLLHFSNQKNQFY